MKLISFSGGMLKDNTSMNLEFKNESLSIWSEYTGALPIVDPVTIAADATEVALTSDGDQYLITSGAAAAANITAFTGMTASQHLKVVELVGLGGDVSGNHRRRRRLPLNRWYHVDIPQWERGSHSKIYKMGASTYKFIEMPGSRLG